MTKHDKAINKIRDKLFSIPQDIDRSTEVILPGNDFYDMLGGLKYRIPNSNFILSVEHFEDKTFSIFITTGAGTETHTEIGTQIEFDSLAREVKRLINVVKERP